MEFGKKLNILGKPDTGVAGTTKTADSTNEAQNQVEQGDAKNETDALDKRIEESNNVKPVDAGDKAQTYTAERLSDPSAEDLGLNAEDFQKNDPVGTVLAEDAAARAGGVPEGFVSFSSHPIQSLQVGPYQFERTLLKLTESQVPAFEELLDKLPAADRANIKKLNLDRVDEIVKSIRPAASQNFDSSAGRGELEDLMKLNPRVGTVPLDGPTAHANVSQTDGNVEYVAPPANGEGNGEQS